MGRRMTDSSAAGRHMSPEEFRHWGYAVIDWLAAYQERVGSLPVQAQVRPGQVRACLPAEAPTAGEPFDLILRDVAEKLLPGITHWQSPSFFGYFPANTSGPAILGELLSAGLGVQGMLWATSPACTELETLVLDWLVGMLGLPDQFRSTSRGGGVIQDSASSAALCALIAARERATGYASNEQGADGRLTAYASAQTHSSIGKAVRIAGLGSRQLRLIETDQDGAMRPDQLALRLREDRQAGLVPCFLAATVGTTSSHAVDPLAALGPMCREQGVWLHVDAAMAGTAALCPEFRYLQAGVEGADSYCFNPHKWMFTNFDCDCFWVADRQALVRALTILPEYLRNQATASGAVIDYRDWQIPLGRRFRSLKLWLVIRHYGIEGLQALVRHHVALAQQLARQIAAEPRFELVVPPPLNLVCFRLRGSDARNQQLLDRLNASGALFLTHTRIADRLVLRLSIGQTHTEAEHVERAWQAIQAEAEALAAVT